MALDYGLDTDFDEHLFILNFGTRLLTAFTDEEILVPIALETVADFSRGRRVAILTLCEDASVLRVRGILADMKVQESKQKALKREGALESALCSTSVCTFPLILDGDIPLPASENGAPEGKCLCLPLVGSQFRVLGLITIELQEGGDLEFQDLQQLRVLSTVLAISLENAALFAQLIRDGLTGLFVRRYYEIRVEEELAKLRRQPGRLSMVILDLDCFKEVNDRYGHLMGDQVLREFAELLKGNMRRGVDVVCRYGGEEFIVLLPETGLEETYQAAERIRRLCQAHVFRGPETEVRITVSGGVASVESGAHVTANALFREADDRLYLAKQRGRNRIEPHERATDKPTPSDSRH